MFEKLNNLRIWHKLILVTGLLALPILALLFLFVSSQDRQVAQSRRELDGLEFIAAVRPVLEDFTLHRDLSYAIVYGDESQRDRLDRLRKKLESDLAAVEALDERVGRPLRLSENWQTLKAAWRQLQPQATTLAPRDTFARHSALITQTLELIREAGENSNLRTDQNVDIFYLADTLLSEAPQVTEQLSQLRSYGTALAARGKASPEESAQVLYLANLLENSNETLQRNLAGALRSGNIAAAEPTGENAKASLNQVGKNASAAIDKFRLAAQRDLAAKADAIAIEPRVFSDLGNAAVEDTFTLIGAAQDRIRTQLNRRIGDLNDEKLAQIVIGLLLLTFTGVVAFSVNLGITRQIRSILRTFESISSGDLIARADVYYTDELGQVATSLNKTLDNTVSLIQSREERDRIQRSIMKLLDEVSGVAEGDLTKEAEVTSEVTGAIADSFNYMMGELRRIIASVQATTVAVDRSTRQMQSSAEALAAGSGQQSAQITEASKTIEQINESIREVARAAGTAAHVAETALLSARSGSASVQKTIAGMDSIRTQVQETAKRVKRLGESSQEIGEIVQLIGDIADRTSILALNASIQAAAAGEAGRGFAVVAEEVERLAERATESTKRIGQLIRSVQADTNEAVAAMEKTTHEVVGGSQLANDAGRQLSQIEAISSEITQLVRDILATTNQQAERSETVTRKVTGVAEFTTHTAVSAKQVESSVRQLASLAQHLNDSMSHFKLPENEEHSAAA